MNGRKASRRRRQQALACLAALTLGTAANAETEESWRQELKSVVTSAQSAKRMARRSFARADFEDADSSLERAVTSIASFRQTQAILANELPESSKQALFELEEELRQKRLAYRTMAKDATKTPLRVAKHLWSMDRQNNGRAIQLLSFLVSKRHPSALSVVRSEFPDFVEITDEDGRVEVSDDTCRFLFSALCGAERQGGRAVRIQIQKVRELPPPTKLDLGAMKPFQVLYSVRFIDGDEIVRNESETTNVLALNKHAAVRGIVGRVKNGQGLRGLWYWNAASVLENLLARTADR